MIVCVFVVVLNLIIIIECYCYIINIFKKQFDKLVLLAYSTDMTGNSVHKTKLKGEEDGNDG